MTKEEIKTMKEKLDRVSRLERALALKPAKRSEVIKDFDDRRSIVSYRVNVPRGE